MMKLRGGIYSCITDRGGQVEREEWQGKRDYARNAIVEK